MTYEPETSIKRRMRIIGATVRDAAVAIGLPPSTLTSKLAGWSYLSYDERKRLEAWLIEQENKELQAA